MSRPIQAKKGSSLYEAAFSLSDSALITVFNFGQLRTLQFNHERLNCKPSFLDLIDAARESEYIYVDDRDSVDHGVIEVDRFAMDAFVKQCIEPHERLKSVRIFTSRLDEIRALAKEMRSDKAIGRVAKKPVEPKADLKTRRDVI